MSHGKYHFEFIVHTHIDIDDLCNLIFNSDMISTIQGLLADEDDFVRCQALVTLVAFMDHSKNFS
jgi:hypothetical protein